MPKFFVPKNNIFTDEIIINDSDVVHIKNVLRLNIGDTLQLCDGRGMNYNCQISKMLDREIRCTVLSKAKADTEPPVEVTIYQGIPKASKMDYIIQKTTELGVTRIVPCMMARCVSKIENSKDAQKKCERWQKIAREASKQSGRGIIPLISEPVRFSQAVEMMKADSICFAPYECEENNTLKKVLKSDKKVNSISYIIGPEGGFDLDEVELLEKNKITTVTLGKRILRCETAGEAVLAMIMYELGDINR